MQKFLPNVPSPLLYDSVLYLIKDGGILTAVNAKTGEILKQGRLTGALETYLRLARSRRWSRVLTQSGRKDDGREGWPLMGDRSYRRFRRRVLRNARHSRRRNLVRTRGALYCFRN